MISFAKIFFYYYFHFSKWIHEKNFIQSLANVFRVCVCVWLYTRFFWMCLCVSFNFLIFLNFFQLKKRATSWRNIKFVKYSINLTRKPDVNKLNCISGAIVDWSSSTYIHKYTCVCVCVFDETDRFYIYTHTYELLYTFK